MKWLRVGWTVFSYNRLGATNASNRSKRANVPDPVGEKILGSPTQLRSKKDSVKTVGSTERKKAALRCRGRP